MALSPENAWYWITLGSGYRSAKLCGEAISIHSPALELNPDTAYCHRIQGEVYEVIGETRLAREAYMKALEIDPQDTGARDGLDRPSSP